MKRILAFTSIFAVTFLITAGAVLFTAGPAEAKIPPWCLLDLPCSPDDIYCTSTPCNPPAKCHPDRGAIFYCAPDWNTEYCSGDWWLPVPCSHQI